MKRREISVQVGVCLQFWKGKFKDNEAEAEALIFWPPDAKSWLIGRDLDAGKDWGQEEKRATEVGWHRWLNGHESEQTPGDSEEQESLVLQRVGHDLVTEQQQFKGQR